MQKKIFKLFLLFTSCYLLVTVLSGCVSIPKKGQVGPYIISGRTYFSLAALCDLKNIKWEYDFLTRTAALNKDARQIKIQVGEKTIFLDGSLRQLDDPVDIYQGIVVIPSQLRQLIEDLFPESARQLEVVSFYKIKKVIIDPGHGGKDPGALGRFGLSEKYIVLDIAKRLGKLLEKCGVETVLTRSSDKFISLKKRAALTENSRADFFISIHANANKARSLSGFEVYCVSSEVSDYKRALSSARNFSLDLDNSSLGSSDLDLRTILWDMTYTYNRSEAIQLSRDICQSIGHTVDTRIIGVKNANYYVLRETCIPAILVEVGFISNRKEEQLLNKPDYRQKIAEGIKSGIFDYASGLGL